MAEALRLTTDGCSLPCSILPRSGRTGAQEPTLGSPPFLLLPRPSPNSRSSLEPQPAARASGGRASSTSGTRDKVQLHREGSRRPFPRAARPGAGSPSAGGRGLRKAAPARGGWPGRAAPGASPSRAGRWCVGAAALPAQVLLLALGRRGGGPAGLRWGFAQTLSAVCGSPGGGGDSSAGCGPGIRPTRAGAGLEAPGRGPCASACAPCLAQAGQLEPAGRARPGLGSRAWLGRRPASGLAADPAVGPANASSRAMELATVHQAGTARHTPWGE